MLFRSALAGMSLVEVINMAMLSSEYIRKQVIIQNKNESQTVAQEGVVNWWRVLPSIKIADYDPKIDSYTFDIIYFVVPYEVWNTKHPELPKSKPERVNCVKKYSYIYTGENTSILDFQVDFDTLYLTTVTGIKNKNINDPLQTNAGAPSTAEGGPAPEKPVAQISPATVHPISGVSQEAIGRGTLDTIGQALSGISASIYSRVLGDMLTVNLKILGDPTLIKQDELF